MQRTLFAFCTLICQSFSLVKCLHSNFQGIDRTVQKRIADNKMQIILSNSCVANKWKWCRTLYSCCVNKFYAFSGCPQAVSIFQLFSKWLVTHFWCFNKGHALPATKMWWGTQEPLKAKRTRKVGYDNLPPRQNVSIVRFLHKKRDWKQAE